MLVLTAVSLRKTVESMATPCSVKAYGRYLRCFPILLFPKVTNCDLIFCLLFEVPIWNLKWFSFSKVANCDLRELFSHLTQLFYNHRSRSPRACFKGIAFFDTLRSTSSTTSIFTWHPNLR